MIKVTKLATVFLISVIALLMAVPVLANNEQPELLSEEIFEESEFPLELSMPGRIEGTGTYFEIKDSDYLNITLRSTGEIKVVLESIPRMISLNIEVAKEGIDAAELTLVGLEPNKTYYKYQDSYRNGVVVVADENGIYGWEQDLSQPYHIWFQEEKGTIFLPEDCSKYGSWNSITSTCTLNQNLNQSAEIEANNITLDCNGHNITGSGTGYGIYLKTKTGVTIQNCIVTNFSHGIYFNSSSNNTLTNIIANLNSARGILLDSSSNNNQLTNIEANSNTYYGIHLISSSNNIFTNIEANSTKNYYGIMLLESSNNILTNITVSNNPRYGIYPYSSSGNIIYLNNFINNTKNVYSYNSTNFWNSPEKINYIYKTNKYTNYLGNYWSDYLGSDIDGNGIGDISYNFTGGKDNYPLKMPFENYFEVPANQPPTISNLGQFKSDGVISITEGNTTTESSVIFKATLSDSDNDQAKFQIELRQFNEPFTGIDDGGILSSDLTDSGKEATVIREGLIDSQYHWRARAIDEKGAVSDWQEFGAAGNIDFEVKLVPLYTQVLSPYPSEVETDSWDHLSYAHAASDKPYPLCGWQISRCGCAITSMVMLGRYYNIDTAIDSSNVDPGNINAWLTNNKGYTSNGRLGWGKAVEYLGFIDEVTGKRMVRLNFNPYTDYNVPFTSPRINNYVSFAKPVVAYSEKFGHYFIVDNKLAATYGIKDPNWYNTKTLNDPKNLANKVQSYSNYFSKANLFSYLEIPKPITSSLHLYLASPAELLITDPIGRKLGKDPIAGIVYNEIPNSIYTKEGSIVSSDIPLGPNEIYESKVIYIPSPIDGEYDIQVIGIDLGTYTLDFSTYNNIGESTDASFEAVTDTGVISDYSIDYSGVPEEPTIIERIVTIQDVITEIEISHQLNLIDNNGIKNSLIKKLNNAQKKIEPNKNKSAINILNAFINEVEAQKGKHIDLDFAEILINDAQYIIEHL